MNQLAAMRETLTVAQDHEMDLVGGLPENCDYWHLSDMVERASAGDFSPAKLGRWLGWMQCAVVAAGIGVTLEDMKMINMKNREDGD
jgi:hypothetical protein